MTRINEDKLNSRLLEIKKLVDEREKINNRLAELTGLENKDSKLAGLPAGFRLNDEILAIFKENPERKYRILEITGILRDKFKMNIQRRTVQGAMRYLATKKILDKTPEERGVFRLKN